MSTLPNLIIVGWVLDDPQSRDLCNFYQNTFKMRLPLWFEQQTPGRPEDCMFKTIQNIFLRVERFLKVLFLQSDCCWCVTVMESRKVLCCKRSPVKGISGVSWNAVWLVAESGWPLDPTVPRGDTLYYMNIFVSNQRNTKASFIFNVPRVCECMYTSLRWRKCCRRLKRQIHKLRRYQAEVAPLHIRHALYLIHLFVCIIATSPKVAYSPTSLSPHPLLSTNLQRKQRKVTHDMAVYVRMVMIIKASTCVFWWAINRCRCFHLIRTGLAVVTAGYMALWQALIWFPSHSLCHHHHHHHHYHHHHLDGTSQCLDLKVSVDIRLYSVSVEECNFFIYLFIYFAFPDSL